MVTLAAAPKAIVTATRRMSTYCIAEANAGAVMKVPNGARPEALQAQAGRRRVKARRWAGATLPSSEAARYHRPCIATGSHVTTTARRSAALSGWL
jgi:hypothetical protein